MIIRLVVAIGLVAFDTAAAAATCPKALDDATRLVLVSAPSVNAPEATLQLYKREATGVRWVKEGEPFPVVVGRSGLAWGNGYSKFVGKGERAKLEGDLRTPAGIFPIGVTFGFEAQSDPGHIVLKAGETICVADPSSPHYNKIMKRQDAGKVARFEDMRKVSLYRKGIVVDYASDRERRAGSCIFLHLWRSQHAGTNGCVGMPEAVLERIQAFTRVPSAVAVLPQAALARFQPCLPGVDVKGRGQ